MREVSRARWLLVFLGLAVFGLRSALFVYGNGERLTPDTQEYATGHACWSSLVTCSLGASFGLPGVQLWGVLGAALVGISAGALVSIPSGSLRLILLYLLPPGWYLIQASADAGGTAAFILAFYFVTAGSSSCNTWRSFRFGYWDFIDFRWKRILGASFFVMAFHLVAGLVLLVVLLAWCFGSFPLVFSWISGVIAILGEYHFQMRYFLPALALTCIFALRRSNVQQPMDYLHPNQTRALLYRVSR